MPRRYFVSAFAAVLLLSFCALHFPLSAKEEAEPPAQPVAGGPFTGKILAIFTNESTTASSYVVEGARLKTMGNRQFLVGHSASTGDDDWTRELPISIAWDAIVTVIEFESVEQYKERTKENDLRAAR